MSITYLTSIIDCSNDLDFFLDVIQGLDSRGIKFEARFEDGAYIIKLS